MSFVLCSLSIVYTKNEKNSFQIDADLKLAKTMTCQVFQRTTNKNNATLVRKFLKSIKDKIELMYLPAYSPELNPIESFWKKTRRGVTHNRYFNSLVEEGECLKRFFNKFKKTNDVLISLSANY